MAERGPTRTGLHRDRGHGEEVDRDHLTKVVVQEGLSGLAGPSRQFPKKPGDGPFGDLDPSIFNSP
jgi:hypothetical protein